MPLSYFRKSPKTLVDVYNVLDPGMSDVLMSVFPAVYLWAFFFFFFSLSFFPNAFVYSVLFLTAALVRVRFVSYLDFPVLIFFWWLNKFVVFPLHARLALRTCLWCVGCVKSLRSLSSVDLLIYFLIQLVHQTA